MVPPPPPRLSTFTVWRNASDSFCATTRAMASTPPPAGYGTMRVIVRVGNSAACAAVIVTGGLTRTIADAMVIAAAITPLRQDSLITRLAPPAGDGALAVLSAAAFPFQPR